MKKQFDPDLLQEISKVLQYHYSLGIKEYRRTPQLVDFVRKQGHPAVPQPASKKRQGKKGSAKTAEKKHIFDPGLAQKVTLHDVRAELGDCQRCQLHKTRTNIVFGQGSERAKLMIVADAPAREDDKLGIPVQGDAGHLLDKMLAAIGLSRADIYLTTLVKCLPGNDSKPLPDEINTCLPFLFRQIEIICPIVICSMGTLSAQTLLQSRKSLFQLRGRFYNFNDLCSSNLAEKIVVMPSLPPSLLLENLDLKKASWEDLQLIQKKLAEG